MHYSLCHEEKLTYRTLKSRYKLTQQVISKLLHSCGQDRLSEVPARRLKSIHHMGQPLSLATQFVSQTPGSRCFVYGLVFGWHQVHINTDDVKQKQTLKDLVVRAMIERRCSTPPEAFVSRGPEKLSAFDDIGTAAYFTDAQLKDISALYEFGIAPP